MPTIGETFETGTSVEAKGVYVCAPCGFKKTLKTGETFPECDSCTRKDEEEVDEDNRMPPSGIWEFVGEGNDEDGEGSEDAKEDEAEEEN